MLDIRPWVVALRVMPSFFVLINDIRETNFVKNVEWKPKKYPEQLWCYISFHSDRHFTLLVECLLVGLCGWIDSAPVFTKLCFSFLQRYFQPILRNFYQYFPQAISSRKSFYGSRDVSHLHNGRYGFDFWWAYYDDLLGRNSRSSFSVCHVRKWMG